jgi:hypothetical protein
MVASAVLLLDHAPPVSDDDKVAVPPMQTVPSPEIAGDAVTVTTTDDVQPAPDVTLTVAKPAAKPKIVREDNPYIPIPATVVSSTLQEEAPTADVLRIVLAPTHVVAVPVTEGNSFTVMTRVTLQPPGSVYVIVAVP